jgi:predicted DNA-binding transcriptional regulator YafY
MTYNIPFELRRQDGEYLLVAEAARRLGCSKQNLYRMLKADEASGRRRFEIYRNYGEGARLRRPHLYVRKDGLTRLVHTEL